MSDAFALYVTTSAVVVGLVIWVARVLATVKEPWAIGPAPAVAGASGDAGTRTKLGPEALGPSAKAAPAAGAGAARQAPTSDDETADSDVDAGA